MALSATSSHFLNTSRSGDSTTSLESPFQCMTSLSVKKFLLVSNLNLVQLGVMEICCITTSNTADDSSAFFYLYLHVGGSSQGLLRPPASYKLWDSAGHPASSHPTLDAGTLGSHCLFLPGSCLLKNPTPCLMVLDRGLTPLEH